VPGDRGMHVEQRAVGVEDESAGPGAGHWRALQADS
jgi:hypothetical protein